MLGLASGGGHGGTGHVAGLACSEASLWHRFCKTNSMFYAKNALLCDPKLPVKSVRGCGASWCWWMGLHAVNVLGNFFESCAYHGSANEKHGQPRLRCDEEWREAHIKLSKEDHQNSTQWKRPLPGQPSGNAFSRVSLETPGLRNSRHAIRGLSGTPQKDIEHSWHVVLNSKKQPETACVCDAPVERERRSRWQWSFECCMVPWWTSSGDLESGGTFWPRTDETDWCGIFREPNKAADRLWTGSAEGSAWSPRKIAEITSHLDVFRWGQREERIGYALVRFLTVDAYQVTPRQWQLKRRLFQMGIVRLTVLFP